MREFEKEVVNPAIELSKILVAEKNSPLPTREVND